MMNQISDGGKRKIEKGRFFQRSPLKIGYQDNYYGN